VPPVLLFALLACVMIGTRKVDWHSLMASNAPTQADDRSLID
jgi:inner membrane protein involved in colicin E2 resistance